MMRLLYRFVSGVLVWGLLGLPLPVAAVTASSTNYVIEHDNFGDALAVEGTANDTAAPTISNVQTATVGTTKATITWGTDENTTGYLKYGSSAGSFTSTSTTQSASSSLSHSAVISGLSEDNTYYFKVVAEDNAGNTAEDTNGGDGYSFTTLQEREEGGGGGSINRTDRIAPQVQRLEIARVSATSAIIAFETSEDAAGTVKYGQTADYGSLAGSVDRFEEEHEIKLRGLVPDTQYSFRAIATDEAGNQGRSDEETFRTLQMDEEPRRPAEQPEQLQITDVRIENVTARTADVVWRTNKEGNSVVEYGETPEYGQSEATLGASTRQHRVALTGLEPGTEYHTRASTFLRGGAHATSSDITFTTEQLSQVQLEDEVIEEVRRAVNRVEDPTLLENVTAVVRQAANQLVEPPSIAGGGPQVDVSPREATISWRTSVPANSMVSYAAEVDYQPDTESVYPATVGKVDEFTQEHEVQLSNLEPTTTYHYQLVSAGKFGSAATTSDLTFTTPSPTPQVTDLQFTTVSGTNIEISWETPMPAQSEIVITDQQTGETIQRADESFVEDHSFVFTGLFPGREYTLQITSTSEEGVSNTSPEFPFSTTVTDDPPSITNVRISSSLIPGRESRVQTIISWETNKPSTSQVFYERGVSSDEGELSNKTALKDELTLDHTVVLDTLQPGSVYRLQVASADINGSTGRSKFYTILTPKPKESLMDLIIKNFSETFEFFKRIKF